MTSSLHAFLRDLTVICKKHHVEELYTEIEEGQAPSTVVRFANGEILKELEYFLGDREASTWWPKAARFIGKLS